MIVATTYKQIGSHTLQKSHIAYTFIVEVPVDGATIRM
jgi:hypothetical protein